MEGLIHTKSGRAVVQTTIMVIRSAKVVNRDEKLLRKYISKNHIYKKLNIYIKYYEININIFIIYKYLNFYIKIL